MIDLSEYSEEDVSMYLDNGVLILKKQKTYKTIVYSDFLLDKFFNNLDEYIDNTSELNVSHEKEMLKEMLIRLKINNETKRDFYKQILQVKYSEYLNLDKELFSIILNAEVFKSYIVDLLSPKELHDFKTGIFIFNKNPILWEIIQQLVKIRTIETFINYLNINTERNEDIKKIIQINGNVSANKRHIAESYLYFLKGYNREYNKKILENEKDYDIILEGVYCLVETDSVEPINKKVRLNLHTDSIKQTFYMIHNDLYGQEKRIHDSFIYFMKEYFVNFENTEISTLKTKFSVKSKRFPFNKN